MDLNVYFQLSVSIFCTLAIIFLLTFFVWMIMLRSQIGKLIAKIDEIVETAKSTAGEAKAFTERTIASLETFKSNLFTFDFIRRIVTEVISLIKNNSKGDKNGQK